MNLEFDSSISAFLEKTTSQLEKQPSVHSFILSLARKYEEMNKPIILLVRGLDKNGNLLIAGVQTESKYPLIISQTEPEYAKTLSQMLAESDYNFPGVNGPTPAVDAFAESWSQMRLCKSELGTNLRLFELTTVKHPPKSPGFFRSAKAEDEEVIFQWLNEFHTEAVPHDPKRPDDEIYKDIREATRKEQFFIWEENSAPVCLVGSKRETQTERWIAPVYTPPHLRGRGYASALVAAVSQKIVDSGKKGMLFTDLSNPTSNSIYQKVGYSAVADFRHYFFKK